MPKKIKLGMLGLGRAGRGMHLSELAGKEDKFEIYAVCDLEEDRRTAIAEKYNCKAYACFEDMLQDSEIDIFDIAVRSCDHYRYAKAAIEAGRNVMLEKPMTITYAEAEDLIKTAEQKNVKLYIRHNRRWEGLFNQVRDLISSGIIGDAFQVVIKRNSFSMRNDWQTIRKYGGGQLLNWGPHIIDQSLQFCGGDYTSLYSDFKQINASGNCEDHVHIILKGINGVTTDMEISCGCAVPMPIFTVYGTRGTIVADEKEVYIRYIEEGYTPVKLPPIEGNPPDFFKSKAQIPWLEKRIPSVSCPLDQTWTAMYADFREGVTYPISHAQALKVMQVVEDARKVSSLR